LINENYQLIERIKKQFPIVDTLIFCATKHNSTYVETSDGLEYSYALDYLSRFILSYGLKESLESANDPIILNICGTGINGSINWNDLQHKERFVPLKVMMHGSRLNDLSGVEFSKRDTVGKIKYILFNPMAVKTPGMQNTDNFLLKLLLKIVGKPIEKAIIPIINLLNIPPTEGLTSFTKEKKNSLAKETFNKANAQKLYVITMKILDSLKKLT